MKYKPNIGIIGAGMIVTLPRTYCPEGQKGKRPLARGRR